MTERMIEEHGTYIEPVRRRYGLYATLVVVLLALGYWLSPYVAATRFALAAQSGSVEAVTQRIDQSSLRTSFTRQIVRTYLARNPQTRGLDPLSRQAVGGVATGFVSGIISEYLTPELIADLLRQGRGSSRAGVLLGETTPLPRIEGLQQAWTMFMASGFTGLSSFAVALPRKDQAEGYRLIFGLRGIDWSLTAIELPDAALNRLADELALRIDRKP